MATVEVKASDLNEYGVLDEDMEELKSMGYFDGEEHDDYEVIRNINKTIKPVDTTQPLTPEEHNKVKDNFSVPNLYETESKEINSKKSRGYVFTWNNYPTEITLDELGNKIYNQYLYCKGNNKGEHQLKCVAFGEEIAPDTGTPHLQGFLYFHQPQTWPHVKEGFKLINPDKSIYFAHMKYHVDVSVRYCKKDDKFHVFGELPMTQKQKGACGSKGGKSGVDEYTIIRDKVVQGAPLSDIVRDHPELGLKHWDNIIKYMSLLAPRNTFSIEKKFGSLLPWQAWARAYFTTPPDDRKIVVIFDYEGAKGKTTMIKDLVCNSTSTIDFYDNMKKENANYLFNPNNHSVFNYTCSVEERINWEMVESFKDQCVISTKYVPIRKLGTEPKHLVIFSNYPPQLYPEVMKPDRWILKQIVDRWVDSNGTYYDSEYEERVIYGPQIENPVFESLNPLSPYSLLKTKIDGLTFIKGDIIDVDYKREYNRQKSAYLEKAEINPRLKLKIIK